MQRKNRFRSQPNSVRRKQQSAQGNKDSHQIFTTPIGIEDPIQLEETRNNQEHDDGAHQKMHSTPSDDTAREARSIQQVSLQIPSYLLHEFCTKKNLKFTFT